MQIRPEQERSTGWWELSAFFFCLVIGTADILNVHPIGDGLWFWYARQFREGSRLYADLHLNLQPFYVLLTAAFQKMLGLGWIASKAPAFLQLISFSFALVLISRRLLLKPWQRAILIVAVFLMTIAVSWARFDDFHVVTHCFVIYSVYALLRYREGGESSSETLLAVTLGAMSGFSIVNRLNDGASLVVASLIALPFFVRRNRAISLLGYVLVTVFCVFLTIKLTGDTVSVWATESIFHAATIKGGTGPILLQPVLLPFRLFKMDFKPFGRINAMMLVATFYAMYAAWAWPQRRKKSNMVGLVLGALLLSTMVPLFVESAARGRIDMSIGVLGILLGYLLAFSIVYAVSQQTLTNGLETVDPLPLLLLFPFGQLLGADLTSGRLVPEHTPAIGMLLLLLPLAYPVLTRGLPRVGFVTFASLLAIAGLPSKILHPYYWHHYDSAQMFENREWYRHPTYGPMLIDREQERLMTSFCSVIRQDHADTPQLLSLPYPYPNYFCGIEPWHGYVQTWYDTSGVATINHLVEELNTNPPRWIVYQRGLDTMHTHEAGYSSQQLLPQRKVDKLILEKILDRQWTVAKRSCFSGADWILIRTTAPSMEENDYPVMSTDRINLCEGTANNYLTFFY